MIALGVDWRRAARRRFNEVGDDARGLTIRYLSERMRFRTRRHRFAFLSTNGTSNRQKLPGGFL